jgi:hypothetical protein
MGKGSIGMLVGAIAVAALWAEASSAGDPAKISKAAFKTATGRAATGRHAAHATSAGRARTPCRLPATGQTSTTVNGDDGSVRAGTPLSYVDNGDGTITDRTTGLMWEKKVKLDGTKDPTNLHDADNCYPWQGRCAEGGAACATNADCGLTGRCEAADCQTEMPDGLTIFQWAARLNVANFAGHDDWRVPNARELQSIANYNVVNPAVAPAFNGTGCGSCDSLADPACSCTQSANYWSSTMYALRDIPDGAWVVYFSNGTVIFNVKTNTYFVRAVRGGL